MRLVGVPGVVAVWLILCPGCRMDREQLSHRRQRVVGCVDGVAGLEGRFRKIESCDESLFVHGDDRARMAGCWCGGAERVIAVVVT